MNDRTSDFPPITGLYVPGHRADRFERAFTSGADLVILDLEDAVPDAQKAQAREAIVAALAERVAGLRGEGSGTAEVTADAGADADADATADASANARGSLGARGEMLIQVRVNAGPFLADDLAAIAPFVQAGGAGQAVEVRLPKVEAASDVDRVIRLLDEVSPGSSPRIAVTAILETALGVERAFEIASHPAVTRLALGESDLASDLATRHPDVIAYARTRVLFAARAAGLDAPMMSAYPDIRDQAGLRADTADGATRGWLGRVAIHPSQLAVIASAFRPEPAEVVWAEQVLEAMRDGGVTTLASGEMVDPAMIGRARSIIARKNATAAVT
jgi:citrate lyase subunit beta/citryl-CoA lyase